MGIAPSVNDRRLYPQRWGAEVAALLTVEKTALSDTSSLPHFEEQL